MTRGAFFTDLSKDVDFLEFVSHHLEVPAISLTVNPLDPYSNPNFSFQMRTVTSASRRPHSPRAPVHMTDRSPLDAGARGTKDKANSDVCNNFATRSMQGPTLSQYRCSSLSWHLATDAVFARDRWSRT